MGGLLFGSSKGAPVAVVWKTARALAGSTAAQTYLSQGFEPFAVVYLPTAVTQSGATIPAGLYIYYRKFG